MYPSCYLRVWPTSYFIWLVKNNKVQFEKFAILLIGGIKTMTMELIKDSKRFFLEWGRTIHFLKISYFDVGSNALD